MYGQLHITQHYQLRNYMSGLPPSTPNPNKISGRYQCAKNSLRKHLYADKPRRTSSVSTLSKRAGPRSLPPQRHQLRMRLIRTRSPGSCSTVLPLVPEGFGFSTTAPASQRRPYPEGPEDRAHVWETRATETWIAFQAPRRILADRRPRYTPTRCLRAGRLDHPAFLRVYTTHTRAHRDSPKRAPSPMAYSSLVCTPAPRAGGLPPGNQPTSRLHCQARRHSPPPDASTKLCCDVPKEPQPDDDGRNLTLMGSPSRRSAEGRSTERAVPATGSASNTFGAHDGELFQRKMMYGRTRTEPAKQARGDRSLQK